ncbi:MAG: hypothetical protein LBJ21_01815 [Acidobacteriota bacterium]|nr:hypothetical protein [Acidobacteriota bacterium]
MKRNHTLTEIIFSIIAMAFVGIFAVRMYVKADNLQNRARDLDMASFAAQSAIEAFKSEYTNPGTVYFDRDFRAVPEIDKKGFVLTMDIADDGMGLFDVKVDVVKAAPYFGETETDVFSLTTSVYKGIGR